MRELALTITIAAALVASLVIRVPVPAWVSPTPMPIFAVVELAVLAPVIPALGIALLWFMALLIRDGLRGGEWL